MNKNAPSPSEPELPMKDITPPKQAAKAKEKPAPKPKGKAPPKEPARAVAVRKPSAPAPAANNPTNMLAVIARAAADPNVVPEKMRALLDMQKEIVAEEARIAFTEDFIKLQADLPEINQTGRIVIPAKREGGREQSTPYAKFDVIHRAIRPILKKHHFTISYATEATPDGARILVKTFLDHARGHQRSTTFPLPAETSGSKNNVQGWGSAVSYGKRYGTIALLNIVSRAPEDADDDGAGGEKVITAAQVKILRSAMNVKDCPEPNVLAWAKKGVPGIERLEDLPADLFDRAHTLIQNFNPRPTK